MNSKVERIKKVSATTTVIVWIVQIILAATIGISIFNWVTNAGQHNLSFILSGASSLIGVAGLLVLFCIILKLLKSFRNGRTPFAEENVKRLKWVALLLSILAALQFITDAISSATINVVQPPNAQGIAVAQQTVSFHYASLVMLILGLIVYCVALAFQYGTELQQQSDETL